MRYVGLQIEAIKQRLLTLHRSYFNTWIDLTNVTKITGWIYSAFRGKISYYVFYSCTLHDSKSILNDSLVFNLVNICFLCMCLLSPCRHAKWAWTLPMKRRPSVSVPMCQICWEEDRGKLVPADCSCSLAYMSTYWSDLTKEWHA